MISLIELLLVIILMVGAYGLGWFNRAINDKLKQLSKPEEPEPEGGVTYGSEIKVNEYKPQDPDGQVVEPKTPQKIAFEAEEATRREGLGIKR